MAFAHRAEKTAECDGLAADRAELTVQNQSLYEQLNILRKALDKDTLWRECRAADIGRAEDTLHLGRPMAVCESALCAEKAVQPK